MPPHHCRAPGCGRFVAAGEEICSRCTSWPDGAPLDPEITALRKILGEAQTIQSLETRAKLIPRIVSVSIQAIKTGHQLGGQESSELMRLLETVGDELESESR